MVLEKLGNSLKSTLSKVAKAVFVDERLVNELIKDIQKALLQSDVNVKLVFELTETIKKRALKEEAPKTISKKEHLIKIVYEELVKFLGGKSYKLEVKEKPFKIMLIGLFGSGKTTTAGKLANYFTKRGYKVALVGLDTHRVAAMEQIEQIAIQAKVPFFIDMSETLRVSEHAQKSSISDEKEKDPVKIWNSFKNEFKKYDILIIDTAGRDALSKELIEEIEALNKEIKPDENLLIISADIGQAAQKQAEQFHKSCNIAGVIATKMDGTARGGGALSACAVTKAPIKFIGVGEKLNEFEQFNPEGFVGRLLGMGDIEALLEKAKEAITEEQAEDLGKRFLKGDFNLIDLYEQMTAMKKMGSLSKLVEMIPGFGQLKLPKDALQVQEGKLEKWRFCMNSMRKEELENPEIISSSRIERIAKGSGVSTKEVRELIKQYRQSKKLVKMMKGKGDVNKLMKKFSSKMPQFKFK